MEATLRASTGAKITVWRIEDTYHARLTGTAHEPQVCLGIDLFEVIAELCGLDLEIAAHSEEALALADQALRLLGRDNP